jgi:hypothetical protein
MGKTADSLGKKIFFLYPSAVVLNRIAVELVQQEYEVYLVQDHQRLRKILRTYPDSIVFASIHEGMGEKEWETWIRGVMDDPHTSQVGIGIIANNENEGIKKKYLYDVKIKGGYTVIKSDLNVAIKQLCDILMSLDAKGRRKYLRAITENDPNTIVNFARNGIYIKGFIKDISVVGFSCALENDPSLPKNSLFQDIQVKLQTTILKAEGIVMGSRIDENVKVYVLIFTQRIDPDTKARIRRYIRSNLQAKMDAEFKAIAVD